METSASSPLPVLGCALCPPQKPAQWCAGCPREKACKDNPYHFVDSRLSKPADIILVAEAPVIPKISTLQRIHKPFGDDGGMLVTRAVDSIKAENQYFANLVVHQTYAVSCTSNAGDKEPPKAVMDRCKNFLHASLATNASFGKNPIIIAMGMTAVKALGIKAAKLADVQGRVLPGVQVGDQTYTVVVTFSMKQMVSMPGIYNTFLTDIRRAMQISCEGVLPQVPMHELTKGYIIPVSIPEVKDVCDLILSYSEQGTPPQSWFITADTETNTKFPHRDTLKALCVSFAWATGKACAVPLFHKETPYDPVLAVPYVKAVLASLKPKGFHNAKFDLKVFMKYGWPIQNVIWDTMLGEHALEEDKKGQYGLKPLTKVFYPEFAGYADHLHELLEKEEGDSQLDNIRKAQKKKTEEDAEGLGEAVTKKKLTKKQKNQLDGGFENIPLSELLPYAAIDTDITRRLAIGQLNRIAKEENEIRERKKLEALNKRRLYPVPQLCKQTQPVKSIVVKTAVPAASVLAEMEFTGVKVDRNYLEKLQSDLGKVISEAESDLYKMAGKSDFSLNSAAEIAKILFSEGFIHPETGKRTWYPPVTWTKKGQAQTTEKVLKFLTAAHKCPFSSKKLVYSKAYKAKNTFCQNVWDLSTLDGRLHTNYNIHGTATGRLSSNDENMQNIPKKLAGYSIKKIFIPSDPSLALVNCDAKNAEVRIFSAYSGDQELIKSINDGLDTHCFFADAIVSAVRNDNPSEAAEILKSMGLDDQYPLTYADFKNREDIKLKDKRYGEMLDNFRTAIKRVVFGILYGAQAKKIAETIGISKQQAQAIIDMLFQLYPSIKRYLEQTEWELNTFGFVETYFGRRRRFSVRGASNYLRSRAQRQSVNFKIQSTSSDIVMFCLNGINEPLKRELHGRLLLTVHDSIGFEVPKKYLSQLPDFLKLHLEKKVAEACPWLPVAFKWDFEVGDSYGELKSLDAYMKNLNIEEINDEAAEAYTEEEVRTELADVEAV
jgi:DNA polymerase I-like protein with 3'-5' exonuclease and polymerase domains